MVIAEFPDPEDSDESGLLAIGGDLEVDSLLLAYSSGIFPWPLNEEILTWFSPPRRAVLHLTKLHISRSLRRALNSNKFEFAIDCNCPEVIRQCRLAGNRRTGKGNPQSGTWITADMQDAYIALHKAGYCHSAESYENGELVGGLYGVSIGAMFAGESMFFKRPDASKVAFARFAVHLRESGAEWLDCQVMTPLFEAFGAEEIEREEFLGMLKNAIRSDRALF